MRLNLSRTLPAMLLAFGLAACGDESAPEEGHTPHNGRLFLNGVDVSDPGPLSLASNQTVRVEVRFFDEHGEQITGIEDEHFARVNVLPEGLVSVSSVEGEHFLKDITAGAGGGSGTYTIGFGHDETADELSFGLYDIVVAPPAIR